MSASSIDTPTTNCSNRREMLARFTESIMSTGTSSMDYESTHIFRFVTHYLPNEEEKDPDITMTTKAAFAVSDETTTSMEPTNKKHYTALADYTDAVVAKRVIDDLIYGEISGLVYDEICTQARDIVYIHIPSDTHDDVCNDNIESISAYYFAGGVGQLVQGGMNNLTASLVDSAIVNAGMNTIDGVAETVGEATMDIIKDKITDIVENALVNIVCRAFCRKFPCEFIKESSFASIELDSRDKTACIVENIACKVEDIATGIVVAAFDYMIDSIRICDLSTKSTQDDNMVADEFDNVPEVDAVADKVADMTIHDTIPEVNAVADEVSHMII